MSIGGRPDHLAPWAHNQRQSATELRTLENSSGAACVIETVYAALRWEEVVSILAWIVLGLIAGFAASKIVNRQGEGMILDMVLGMVGALVGGWILSALGGYGVTGFDLYSILVAILGAVVLLVIGDFVRRS
jgi:uncharacterized membrane protein YeaQ/YmgE (transglycosylase-associated protein family)